MAWVDYRIPPLWHNTHKNFFGHDMTPTVYLSSPVNALVNGLYEENVHFTEVKKHGDFGLGTFDDLDGEMILLDGRIFQIGSDGHVTQVDPQARTPFAMVTFFKPTIHDEIQAELSHTEFEARIAQLLPSPNLFYAIRVEGAFTHIQARSVPKQANYHPFVDVAHQQKLFEFDQPQGILAGFYTPAFMSSLSVPGLHLHFLSSDLQHGGHVLQCRPNRVRISIQVIHKLELSLPMTVDYLKSDLSRDVNRDLNLVEK
jgi:acetolactate decarboxylase